MTPFRMKRHAHAAALGLTMQVDHNARQKDTTGGLVHTSSAEFEAEAFHVNSEEMARYLTRKLELC